MGLGSDYLQAPTCSPGEQRLLTALAHQAIQAAILGRPTPDVPPDSISGTLSEPCATFVTLTLDARLRGCVGNLIARDVPLYRSVMTNAVGAALRDTRFEPVTLEESNRLEVHISLLSTLYPLQFGTIAELLNQITPGMDGVVLRRAGQTSTYLPQVWKSFPTKEEFLGSLCRKAGLEVSAWKQEDVDLFIYRVSAFGDPIVP